MSNNSFRMDVYLPDFESSVKYCKAKYSDLELANILDHAWNMTKQFHPHMTNRDKSFLFKCVGTNA